MTPEVERINKRLRLGRPVTSRPVQLTTARIRDRRVIFCTDMENDPIQRNHRRGQFYEAKELAGLAELFPAGGTFVDIGANVGNHSLYAALFLGAARVIAFEPNPLAYRLLVQNVLVNGLEQVIDLSRLGVGVGAREEGGYSMERRRRNLGGAKMLPGESGKLRVLPGDILLEGEAPALIKIDVEGMEMAVLEGLKATLRQHRPVLLVEVDNENEAAFMEWAEAAGYDVARTVQRYRLNKNHLLTPHALAADGSEAA
ncbi:MAG TPA: FkbM family methyltransferase [Aliiroseovarius sp.]|nr:FkbM family methyltransferase [Aliiroseovarius sp.]